MAKQKGTVSKIGKGKFGFFLMLGERDGFYFNTKFEPKVGEGDVVGIDYTPKGDTRGNVSKVTMLTDNGGPKGATAAPASTSRYSASPDRQDSIVYQSSRKDALVFLGLLVEQGGVKLAGAADAKRLQLTELLDEITVEFFKAAEKPRESNALSTEASVAKDSADDEWEQPEKAEESSEWDDEWEN